MRVTAIGQDSFWLTHVHHATAGSAGNPPTLKCAGDLLKCVSSLPKPNSSTVLLVDASGQGDLERVVTELRCRGWKYVIVVAADPSAKEATAVLRRNLGYDYWEKTYDEKEIQTRVKICFDEIVKEEKRLKKTKHNP